MARVAHKPDERARKAVDREPEPAMDEAVVLPVEAAEMDASLAALDWNNLGQKEHNLAPDGNPERDSKVVEKAMEVAAAQARIPRDVAGEAVEVEEEAPLWVAQGAATSAPSVAARCSGLSFHRLICPDGGSSCHPDFPDAL